MEESTKHKTKRMRKFFMHFLDTGSCWGLTWVDRAQGMFKVPWYHINKIDAKDIPKKFQVCVEWAKWTGSYEEGDTPEYSKFKTRLRSALNKLEDFEEVQEGDLKTTLEFCRIFRFRDWPEAGYDALSPDSTTHRNGEPLYSPVSQVQDQLLQSQASNPNAADLCIGQYNTPSQEMVRGSLSDHLSTGLLNNSNVTSAGLILQAQGLSQLPTFLQEDHPQDLAGSHSMVPDFWVSQPAAFQQSGLSQPQGTDTLQQAMLDANIPVTTDVRIEHPQGPADSRSGFLEQSLSASATDEYLDVNELLQYLIPNAEVMNAENPMVGETLSPDLETLDLFDLVPSQPALEEGLNTPQLNECSSNVVGSAPRAVFPDTLEHGMTIVLFYGPPKRIVLNRSVGPQGCRLFFGGKVFENTLLDEKMYGPKTVEQVSMPPVEDIPIENVKAKQYVASSLDAMSRGVVLTLQDGDIYAKRLCTCRVYACRADFQCHLLSRDDEAPEKVFDFRHFRESLQAGHRQAPYFILTFAKSVNLASQNMDPLEKVLVYAYVYHKAAQQLCESHTFTVPSAGSLVSSEPELSGLDGLDQVEQHFKNLAV